MFLGVRLVWGVNSPGAWGLPQGVTPAYALSVLLAVGGVTVLLRWLPFVAARMVARLGFARVLRLFMPVGVMVVLVVYCVRGVLDDAVAAGGGRGYVAVVAAVMVTVGVHWWRRSAASSILVGTVCYVLLASLWL